MRINMYEVFEDFEKATTEKDRALTLIKNDSKTLREFLKLAFDPQYEFWIKSMPDGYKPSDSVPGASLQNLSTELRKLYLFRKGDPTADRLDNRRRAELFLNLAESIEPKEAQFLLRLMNKDLKVKGLDKKLIKKVFPGLL